MKRMAGWLAVFAVILLLLPQLQAEAGAHDRAYHFGFKKSKDGALPSIDEEGFKPILQKHGAIFLGDTSQQELYLTFDNGYENGYTARVLDVLKEKQVPAAFFVTGHYVKDQPELVKRMVQEGHLVGNHSWSHPDMSRISESRIQNELDRVKQQVANVSGQTDMRFMRPPRGIFSDRMLAASRAFGYTNVFWSVAYKDWDVNDQKGGDYAYRMVVSQLHPGAVILLHTVSKDNADALGRIIDEARRRGYAFRTLEQLKTRSSQLPPSAEMMRPVPSALTSQPVPSVQPTPDADADAANLIVIHRGKTVASIDSSAYRLPVFPLLRQDRLDQLLDDLDRQVFEKPRDAKIGSSGEIIPEQGGYKLDRQQMADQLFVYLHETGTAYIEAPIAAIHAKVDRELIGQLRDKRLGYYYTYYNAGNRDRSHNIALAAEAIDSAVVFPGETFSFNRVVGMRTVGKGYRRAPVIVKGELSEGIGGGICQVSSTLFNAVDRAGLAIVERYSHSREVPYVLPGRDATVSWGGPDFVFQNRYNQPVLIRAHAAGGRMFAAVYSSDVIEYSPRGVPEMFKRVPQEIKAHGP